VRNLAGTLGTSDLTGNVFLEMQDPRSLLRAELFSRHLDVRDLQTFSGAFGPPAPQLQQRRRGKTPRQRRSLTSS
jgi:hypothetical protein